RSSSIAPGSPPRMRRPVHLPQSSHSGTSGTLDTPATESIAWKARVGGFLEGPPIVIAHDLLLLVRTNRAVRQIEAQGDGFSLELRRKSLKGSRSFQPIYCYFVEGRVV